MITGDRVRIWLEERPVRADVAALLTLTLLWGLYFWRVLTPNPADQVSLPEGDFSGQFLAFGAYQARRILAGEIPLWNPYNYAGSPFIGDTQAVVLYPPRLMTILVSHFAGGWSYAALQMEAIVHFWLGALWAYLFIRTVTTSRIAGLVSAIVATYGGYQIGYPILQLAVLEAGVWLPLVLLGIYRASSGEGGWLIRWLALSSLGIGLSLLAGHPQTTLYLLYVAGAYLLHRAMTQKFHWLPTLAALAVVVALGFGLAAVQVLPGIEYTRLTIRAGYGIDEVGKGFPFSDLIVFLVPNVITIYSPLYNGIASLALAGIAVWRRRPSARFWAVVVAIAIFLSFGGGTIVYQIAYLLAPGFALFRQQERAAYVIAQGISILAGIGTASLLEHALDEGRLGRVLGTGSVIAFVLALELFVADGLLPEVDLFALKNGVTMLAILMVLMWVLVGRMGKWAQTFWWPPALVALLVFDLFSATMGANWESVPSAERDLLSDLVPVAQADDGLFRVDGRLGLEANNGTMVGLQDIRGISPLRLQSLDQYLNRLPQYRLHQLLAVKYVFTDWQELEVPSTIRAEMRIDGTTLFLHEIDEPMPRAWMAYRIMVAPDDEQVLGWLADPGFDVHRTVILEQEPALEPPSEPPQDWSVDVIAYEPEYIAMQVQSSAIGILVVSEMYYPGWRAMVDGVRVETWRANAGLRALVMQSGTHRVEFRYAPATVRIGCMVSILSLVVVAVGCLYPGRVFHQQRG